MTILIYGVNHMGDINNTYQHIYILVHILLSDSGLAIIISLEQRKREGERVSSHSFLNLFSILFTLNVIFQVGVGFRDVISKNIKIKTSWS